MSDNYIPLVTDDQLLKTEGDAILIPSNRGGGSMPVLARIGGELRRLVYDISGSRVTTIQRHTAPTNIEEVYYGRPGETLNIEPSGGTLIGQGPSGYVFLDSDMNQVSLNVFSKEFPETMGASETYYVYPSLKGSGAIIEFTLKSVPEVVPIQTLNVSDLSYDIPAEVYPGLEGIGAIRFTVEAAPVGEEVTVKITRTQNIQLSKMKGLLENELVNYVVNTSSYGDVVLTYHYITNTGKRTTDRQLIIPNNLNSGNALPYSFINTFPQDINPNDTFTWRYGNVASGVTLMIVGMRNLTTNHSGSVAPGEGVPFQITGRTGEPISLTYALLYDGGVLATHTESALIGEAEFDLGDMSYSTSPDESDLYAASGSNSIDITLNDLPNYETIEMFSPADNVYVSNNRGTVATPTFTVTVAYGEDGYDPTVPLVLSVVVTGYNSSGVLLSNLFNITLTVQQATGEEVIGLSRIFTKPATATTLTITASGGSGYESTLLTGLINYEFVGGLTKPAPTTKTFSGLTEEEETITFDLAEGTTAYVIWS